MGRSTQWIRRAIVDGVTTADGRLVKLAADAPIALASRAEYRIRPEAFRAWLVAIGYPHLPRAGELLEPPALAAQADAQAGARH